MKNRNYIKICPKCGDILPIITEFIQILAPMPEKCKCGYTGLFPEIEIDEVEEFKKKLKENIKISNKCLP